MSGILLLGFLIGMSHALEADHLAAIGAMAVDGPSSKKKLALRGAIWGAGHTISLFIVCAFVLLTGFTLTDQLSATLEFGVGVMLIVIGLDVFIRMRKKRVHFHLHTHDEGKPHLHAHSHSNISLEHDNHHHTHMHPTGIPIKALLIGMTHGVAGSAGLLVLVIAATQDITTALGYVASFGFGSILGMAALSLVVAWPLGFAEKHTLWLYRGLSYSAACVAIILGVSVMLETGSIAFSGAAGA